MPFTPSHAAAALPLRGFKHFRFDALIIGCCIPDLGYYIEWPYRWSVLSHGLWTSLAMGIPFSIPFLFLFRFFRGEIAALLGGSGDPEVSRAGVSGKIDAEECLAILLSLAVGIWSHVFWDGFTHYDGYFVQRISALSAQLGPFRAYKWLQHFSSAIGLVLVGSFVRGGRRRAAASAPRARPFAWKAWIAIAAASAVLAGIQIAGFRRMPRVEIFIVYAAVAATRAVFIFFSRCVFI